MAEAETLRMAPVTTGAIYCYWCSLQKCSKTAHKASELACMRLHGVATRVAAHIGCNSPGIKTISPRQAPAGVQEQSGEVS